MLGGATLTRCIGIGQAVSIGSHSANAGTFNHQQNTIQVITQVLLSHGKMNHAQQIFEHFLRQTDLCHPFFGFLHQREILGGQGLQGKTAFLGLYRHFLAVQLHHDIRIFGE